MKMEKRRMMARKGKKIRTMMTRERDSLTSSNMQRGRTVRKMPPPRAPRSAGRGADHPPGLHCADREDCADAIRLLDVLGLAEALCVAEVDEDAAT